MLGHRLSCIVVAYILIGFSNGGHVPNIPSGRRTQYMFLLDNGGYKYGYDTGSGSSEKTLANEQNQVIGSYSYQSPAGLVSVDYTSGVEGFKPTKVVVPQASDAQWKTYGSQGNLPAVNLQKYNQRFSSGQDSIVTYATTPSYQHTPTIVQPYSGFVATGVKSAQAVSYSQQDESNTGDASYSFGYNAGDHDRQESSDAAGNVVGSYSFVGTDGQTKKVDYVAGAGKGFIAKGNHLPDVSQVHQTSALAGQYTPVQSYTPVNYASHQSYSPVSYAGSSGFVTSGHIPVVQQYSGESKGDASYSFSYNAGDHNRQESSDAAGNVVGSYSFLGTDGQTKKVDYVAGAEKGFIAKGNHLPEVSQVYQTVKSYSPVNNAGPVQSYTLGHASGASVHNQEAGDASYSFSYNAGDHNRQESSDAAGNVIGSYSFLGTDGQTKKVDYVAGAERGFVAKGNHLPEVSQVYQTVKSYSPVNHAGSVQSYNLGHASGASVHNQEAGDASYSFSYNAGDHNRQESSDAAGNVVGSYSFVGTDGQAKKVDYVAGAEKGFIAKGNHLPDASQGHQPSGLTLGYSTQSYTPVSSPGSQQTGGASYSFSYNAGDHSRYETSDASGNVAGSYSIIGTNGQSKKVDYTAGEKGFSAKGHLPEVQSLFSQSYLPSVNDATNTNSPVQQYSLGNVNVKTLLTPNSHRKVGYIFDSL